MNVIQGHPYSCQQKRGVVVRHNYVDVISETYKDMTLGELQIRRFQPLRSTLTTVLREKG